MTVRAPEVPHKVIGPYEVLHKLGEGGMGSVYKARHSRSGDIVAVKIVKPDVASCEVECKRSTANSASPTTWIIRISFALWTAASKTAPRTS